MRLILLTLACALLCGAGTSSAERLKAREYYKRGMAAYVLERWEDAIREFEAGFSEEPEPDFLFNLAQSHAKAKHYREAATFFRKYLSFKPGVADKGAIEKTIREMETLAEKYPTPPTPPKPPTPPVDDPTKPPPDGRVVIPLPPDGGESKPGDRPPDMRVVVSIAPEPPTPPRHISVQPVVDPVVPDRPADKPRRRWPIIVGVVVGVVVAGAAAAATAVLLGGGEPVLPSESFR